MGEVKHWELCKKLNLTIWTNEIYTSQNLFWKMRQTISAGILRYKRIPNLGQTTGSSYSRQQKKKKTCRIVYFVIPPNHRVKTKESEKRDKYLDLAREIKTNKLWNTKVTVKPIVIHVLVKVSKGLIKWLEDLEITVQVEIFQTTALLISARILSWILEICGDSLSHSHQWKTICRCWCENLSKE